MPSSRVNSSQEVEVQGTEEVSGLFLTYFRATTNEHKEDFDAFDLNKDGFIDAYEIREKNPHINQ